MNMEIIEQGELVYMVEKLSVAMECRCRHQLSLACGWSRP